ncbi:MAG: DUF4962 domain-containing protein [Planctomycetes bacterium]|nr:DUF4962 domain-containing protein [Planctomycetota bacterium]
MMLQKVFGAVVATVVICTATAAGGIEVKPGHQRLMLAKGDVERAARNIAANGADWRALKAKIDAGTAPVPAYGIVYLATGEKAVGAGGVEKLMASKDVEEIALGYDWLWGLLADAEKKALFEKVRGLVAKDAAAKMSAPWTNFVQRSTYRLAVAGAAFTPDFPEAKKWIEKAYADWKDFHLPASLITGKGGGWAEGTLYSYIVFSSLVRTADVFWTATDTDIYKDTPWFADRITWWRFHTWPMPKRFYSRLFYMYHPYGDSERWRAPMQNQEIAAELLVMRYFDDSDAVREWRWYMSQLGGSIASPGSWEILAYYDENAPVKKPTALSWLCPGTGQVFIRSSWEPPATWISYQCGPRFTYHQHVDQGAFAIFKQGDLTGESGVYEPSGPTGQEGHLQAYCSRAIAHNTINIYNPSETNRGYRSGNSPRNDGGQRMWQPRSNTALSADYWKEGFDSGAYDTGTIVNFKDIGTSVYIASDLTGAYNSDKYVSGDNISKVHKVTRQLVYVRPHKGCDIDALIVFDRVRTTDPSFETRILLQTANTAAVSGAETKIDDCEYHYDGDLAVTDVGGGRLFARFLYPEKRKIIKLSAPDKNHWVFGKNYPVANTPWERDYGSGRLEVLDTGKTAEHYFLTVLFPADKSVTDTPKVTRLKGRDTLGVKITVGDGPTAHMAKALFATSGEMACELFVTANFISGFRHGTLEYFGSQDAIDSTTKPDGEMTTVFPRPAPEDVNVTDVTTEATVSWKTAEPTLGYVEFGSDMNMRYLIAPSQTPATEHTVTLRGLEPESTAYVRAASKSADGSVGFSRMYTLKTPPDTTPPRIFDATVERANPTDATISWSTDDCATGVVVVTGPGGFRKETAAKVAAPDQRVTLEGLHEKTAYEALITSVNTGGQESKSQPLSFTTPTKPEGYLEIDYEDGELGALEAADAAKWSIDAGATSGGKGLWLSNTGGKRTVAVYKSYEYGDFTLKCKARTVEGDANEWRDYAVVFGYQDPDNYYALRMCGSVDDDIPGITRLKNGKWEPIGTRPNLVTIPDRAWHNIEVIRRGTRIQAFFDGILAFEADDDTFAGGKVGFGSNNDSAAFDDLKVFPAASMSKAPPKIRTKRLTVEGLVKE